MNRIIFTFRRTLKKFSAHGKYLPLAGLLVLAACGDPDVDVVARANHGFNGNHELFAYQAKPSEKTGQAEILAQKQYGSLVSGIKSPQTIFMCLWRNPIRTRDKKTRPSQIFLSCNFAPRPVANPQSIVKMAEIYNTIDRANLKATWDLKSGKYRLSRFEVEIQANGKSYRSQNLSDKMKEISVDETDMRFPETAEDTFRFTLGSNLPFRRNNGEKQKDPIVSMSFSGVAEPIPNWVNY